MEQTKDVARRDASAVAERALISGDLTGLSTDERLRFYNATCESLKLNPLTKPFDYIELDQDGTKKTVLYAKKDCTDQLRNIRKVDLRIVSRDLVDGVYVVTARATLPSKREDESIGAVPLVKEDGEWKTAQSGKRYFNGNGIFKPLRPDERANAIMKAETKAKRRVTLSICGLGIPDESEIEAMFERPVDTAPLGLPAPAAANPAPRPDPPPAPTPRPAPTPAPASDLPPEVEQMYAVMRAEKAAGFRRVFEMLQSDFENHEGRDAGREMFTNILRANGVEKWKDFDSLRIAQKCVLMLFEKLQAIKAANEPPAPAPEAAEAGPFPEAPQTQEMFQ